MTSDRPLPAPGLAEVRIIAASSEVARQVAQVLRATFSGPEQRSYPAGPTGEGTCLRMTVNTAQPAEPSGRPPRRPLRVPMDGQRS